MSPTNTPVLTIAIPARFIRADQYKNFTFALSEDIFDMLNDRLDGIYGKWDYRPLKTFANATTGVMYRNLVIKSKNIGAEHQRALAQNEGGDMTIYVSFNTWKFKKTTGFSVKINNMILLNPDVSEEDEEEEGSEGSEEFFGDSQ